jgi:putative membrane protein
VGITVPKYAAAAVALLVCLAGPSLASAAEATGGKFIKDAIRGNLAEVKVGQLAQEKGASRGVKDFGATLATDHQNANQGATQVAQQMNITAPDKPGLKQKAVYEKLAPLSGDHFDREFIKSMIKDHKEDIAKYQQEVGQGGPAADCATDSAEAARASEDGRGSRAWRARCNRVGEVNGEVTSLSAVLILDRRKSHYPRGRCLLRSPGRDEKIFSSS